jgi:hypothetical protein
MNMGPDFPRRRTQPRTVFNPPRPNNKHVRKCWDCDNVAEHADDVVPYVLCTKCGSQDTRRVKGGA